jgi:enoyl-CoA hydratase/carnithine racemase
LLWVGLRGSELADDQVVVRDNPDVGVARISMNPPNHPNVVDDRMRETLRQALRQNFGIPVERDDRATERADDEVVVRDNPAVGVARISMNRPNRRNAVDDRMRQGLHQEVGIALEQDDVRAIVLTGRGGTFCSGGDLDSLVGLDSQTAQRRLAEGHRIVRLVAGAGKPIVAAVEGSAAGAGAALSVLCDTVVAGESARFLFPFLKLGLVPDYGLTRTLAYRVGGATARQILLRAQTIAATEALRIGLVDEIVPDADVQRTALDLAAQMALMAPFALTLTKQLLADPELTALLEREAATQALCILSKESAHARVAFRAKREPKFGAKDGP